MPGSPGHNGRAPGFACGFSSYAFRWSVALGGWDAACVLDAAGLLMASAGMETAVVQLCDNLPLLTYGDAALADLRARAGDLGITLEVGIQGATPGRLKQGLRAAHGLGASVLRAVLAGEGWSPTACEAERVVRAFLPCLRDAGVALAIENHFDLDVPELAALVELIGDPLVGICLDPFNSIAHLRGPEETVRSLAPYALSMHVKDARSERRETGFSIQGCKMGEGVLNLPGLLDCLSAAGRTPALLLEAWMDRLEDDGLTCAQEMEWNRAGLDGVIAVLPAGRPSPPAPLQKSSILERGDF